MSEKIFKEFENWAYAIENFAPRIERVAEMEFGQAAAAIWEAAWLSSRRQALEEAAAMADMWSKPDAARLAAGEMTPQELRTAQAVARGLASAIRREAEGK